ncbi:DNA cytosine methyltransferase [Thiolapillus brandeum]|uniref:DNA (cytosine-5-)-methyltransferase n=1 Tax=Thiolapillus brandeum TaxID=1076588 RepID=A0A7U6GJU7_9GAMM|nr:DNA cytosine methyltransferase [Thiolapillus brandeum]BAO44986.1 DNA (cytosine-5-)-methyltransferase [Thiolapillus brandeum]
MIRVIDLFAGPGGLGEGFSSLRDASGQGMFQICMSVEKEPSAHATLQLRAFLRQFEFGQFPSEYHDYLRGAIDQKELLDAWPKQAKAAIQETMGRPLELGKDNVAIHDRLRELKKTYPDDAWVVIGGPPCQAYSLAGRSRNRGKRDYRPEKDERNFLYREYLQVLSIVQPEVFVMENVRGMLSAKVAGRKIFHDIISDLRRPGLSCNQGQSHSLEYRIHSLVTEGDEDVLSPQDYLIRAENYGVPQTRHRVILLGVLANAHRTPQTLRNATHVTTVQETISKLPNLRGRISRGGDSPDAWKRAILEGLAKAKKELSSRNRHVYFAMQQESKNLDPNLPVKTNNYPDGKPLFEKSLSRNLKNWLSGQATVLTGHETRGHMASDLQRYFFSSCWSLLHKGSSPRSGDFPLALEPDHANWRTGQFADRFRVQGWNLPSTTITSHISKDGHYFIHPAPAQCRSLTPREAARLQTFPDDYFFMGNRTQQYVQIGNAVPPWLARQIAEVVFEFLS